MDKQIEILKFLKSRRIVLIDKLTENKEAIPGSKTELLGEIIFGKANLADVSITEIFSKCDLDINGPHDIGYLEEKGYATIDKAKNTMHITGLGLDRLQPFLKRERHNIWVYGVLATISVTLGSFFANWLFDFFKK
ncbi:MAG TPA: hypothetical protein DCL44_11385 [Elusimicrobia bacterium]|nr:hypothetical protein [Elusimicrobiota bacterium]